MILQLFALRILLVFHLCSCINVKQAHERFEEPKLEAVRENNVELVQDILKDLTPLTQQSQAAHELARILSEPHFQVYTQTQKVRNITAWQNC